MRIFERVRIVKLMVVAETETCCISAVVISHADDTWNTHPIPEAEAHLLESLESVHLVQIPLCRMPKVSAWGQGYAIRLHEQLCGSSNDPRQDYALRESL
jgi:hypothetical protein